MHDFPFDMFKLKDAILPERRPCCAARFSPAQKTSGAEAPLAQNNLNEA
jgi:hypothetical protein